MCWLTGPIGLDGLPSSRDLSFPLLEKQDRDLWQTSGNATRTIQKAHPGEQWSGQAQTHYSRQAPTADETAKKLELYHKAAARGQDLLCKLKSPGSAPQTEWHEFSELDAWGWTSSGLKGPKRNTYAAKSQKWFEDHHFSLENEPTGNNVEMGYSHKKKTTHKDGGKDVEYPPTGAEYFNTLNVKDGVIIAHHNYGPRYTVNSWRGKNFPKDAPMPKLKSWSDVVFLVWQRMTDKDTRANLKYVLRDQVINEDTLDIISTALTSTGHSDPVPPKYPGVVFAPSEDPAKQEAFEALVGAPNVSGVAWLLIQHFEALGKKTIKSITVWNPSEYKMVGGTFYANVVIELGPASASAKRMRRSGRRSLRM